MIIAEVTLTDTDKSGISALNHTDAGQRLDGRIRRGTQITNFSGSVAGWDVTAGVVNPLSFPAAMTDAGNRTR